MPFQSSHGFLMTAHNEMDNQFSIEDLGKMNVTQLLHWHDWWMSVGGLSEKKLKRLKERLREEGINPESLHIGDLGDRK